MQEVKPSEPGLGRECQFLVQQWGTSGCARRVQ